MTKLSVNGVDVAYDDSGQGPPLLLLHAGIADRRMWEDVTPMLAERFRVLAPDLRGFGETPLPDGHFVYAADAAALLEGLGIERAHVVGVSLGGHIALDLALAHPPAGLILQSPFTSIRDIARVHYPYVPRALVPDAYPSLSRIAGLRAPLLILHGARDVRQERLVAVDRDDDGMGDAHQAAAVANWMLWSRA